MAKLTAAKINKLNKEIDKKRKIFILEDNDEVNISITFKDSSVDKVVSDYISVLEKVGQTDNVTNEVIQGTIGILNLFVLREFSDVPMIPKTNDNIPKLIDITFALYDTGILSAVLEGFDQTQLQKVYDKLEKTSKRAGELLGELAIKSEVSSLEENQDEKLDEDI